MPRFRFRLEPVLEQRRAREDAAEQALALARNEYRRCKALLEDTRRRLAEATAGAAARRGLDIFEEMHLCFYRTSLRKKADRQERDVAGAGRALEERRNQAVQARRERQVIERLKEKHLEVFRREEAAREQKLVDELALYAHLRLARQLQQDSI
ncbi:MAG: flagellar export protein FliJ [Peptococcaceae bacterium]|nr:flagellar export protein FliJ [Peptococcaceae bacterium]